MSKKNRLRFFTTNYQVCIWPLCMLAEMLMYHFYKLAGINQGGEKLGEWENRTNRWAVDIERSDTEIAKQLLNKIEKNNSYGWRMAKKISYFSKRLLKFTKKVFNSDLSKKSDKEIYELYIKYRGEFINMYIYAWFPNSLEGKLNIFTAELENFLKIELKKINKADYLGEYLSVLTSPIKKTNREKEEIEFLKIVELISKNKKVKFFFQTNSVAEIARDLPRLSPAVNKIIIGHHRKYCWLPFDYDGPAWSREYFLEKAKNLIEGKINPGKELIRINLEKKKIKDKQKQFSLNLGLGNNKKFGYFFELAGELIYLKDYRKDALFNSYYHMDKLIREIGRRLFLSPIQVKHILPQEMENVLLNKKFDFHKINERIKYSVVLYEEARMVGEYGEIRIFTGKEARKIVKNKIQEEKLPKNLKEIVGQTAYPGKATGTVKLVFNTDDIKKVEMGDILVSPSTNPNLLPAMRHAGAIVTDKGGITCHAAITSRELKKPCIIGTGIATKILKDNQLVEVDADKGIIKII